MSFASLALVPSAIIIAGTWAYDPELIGYGIAAAGVLVAGAFFAGGGSSGKLLFLEFNGLNLPIQSSI